MLPKISMRNLLTYLVIFVLQFLFVLIAYRVCFNELRNSAYNENTASLARCQEIIDRNCVETVQLANNLMKSVSSSSLINAVSPYVQPSLVVSVRNMRESFVGSIPTTSMVRDILVFIDKPAVVISPNLAYLSYEKFYSNYFDFNGYDYNTFLNNVVYDKSPQTIYPAMPISRFNQTEDFIVFSQRYPLDSTTTKNGRVLALLSVNDIAKLVDGSYLQSHGCFYITDASGQILLTINHGIDETILDQIDIQDASNGMFINVEGQKHLISHITSSLTGWHYIGILNQNDVMYQVRGLQGILYTLIVTNLVISLCIVVIVFFQLKKAIRVFAGQICDNLGGYKVFAKNSEPKQIGLSIRYIVEDNQRLIERMNYQLPVLRNTFVKRLLRRDFHDEHEIESVAAQLGLTIAGGSKAVVGACVFLEDHDGRPTMLSRSETRKIAAIKLKMTELFAAHFQSSFDYDAAAERMFFVVGQAYSSMDIMRSDLSKHLNEVCSFMRTHYNCNLCLCIGRAYHEMINTIFSYQDAYNTMAYCTLNKKTGVVWYDIISSTPLGYYFPLDIEKQLVNRLLIGDTEAIKAIIEKLKEENLFVRNLQIEIEKELMDEMRGALKKLTMQIEPTSPTGFLEIKSEIKALGYDSELIDYFDHYLLLCENICELMHKVHAHSRTSHAMQQVVDFVNENYTSADINMNLVADRFSFAPSYMSRAFKEYTGDTFSSYLRFLRIKAACELMSKDDNIKEISRIVGYYSANSFRAAFKSVTGLSPSQYRNKRRRDLLVQRE